MAESQKKFSSAVNSKEKNELLDLDIGKDFLSSWKPGGDVLDFDFEPVPKGNKKPFQFEKASMDFNLDGDFGMPSFDMNMSDLDIFPPLKKDGKSKEKSKETSSDDKGEADRKVPSFDMDMPDLDILPPLKKDGKSNEKSKESSGGHNKGKADQFDFGFDFELDNFNFEPTLAKKGPEAQNEKDKGESLESLDLEPSLKKEGPKAKKIKDNMECLENLDFEQTLGNEGSKTQEDEHNIESLENSDTNLSLAKDGSKAHKDKNSIDCMENFDFEANLAKEGSMIPRDEDTVQSSENFNFERSLAKDGPEAQKDKDNIESSPDGTQCQDMEGSPLVDVLGFTSSIEDVPPKPSLPETMITFDKDCQVGGGAELGTRRKGCHLKLAMDDSVMSKCSAAAEEVSSDKAKIPPLAIVSSTELPKIRPVEKSVCLEPVDLGVRTGNDADLSSDSLVNYESSGGNSSEVPDKVEGISSIGEQDGNVIPLAGSTRIHKHTKSDSSQYFQTVAISQESGGEKSQHKLESHVKNNTARTDCGQINSVAENSCITSVVSGILSDSPTDTENQGTALETPKLSLVSQPPDKLLANKEMEKGREPPVTLSRFFIQFENPKCHVQEASSTRTTDSPLSSRKKGSTQSSLFEGKRNRDGLLRDRSLGSRSLKHTEYTLLRRELPQKQNQESFKDLKTCGVVPDGAGQQNIKKSNDSFAQTLELVKGKPAQRQRETSLKDLDTLSLHTLSIETKKKTAESSITPMTSASLPAMMSNSVEENNLSAVNGSRKSPNPSCPKLSRICATPPTLNMETNKKTVQRNEMHTTLTALPVTKNTPAEERKLSAVEESSKTPNLLDLKLSSLKLDSTKPQNLKDIKSVGNISQTGSLRSSQIYIANFALSQKQPPSTPSLKRKALGDYNRNTTVLYPSKRISLSPIENRNFADAAIRLLDKKVSNQSNMEDDCIKNTLGNGQVSAIDDIQHKVNSKGLEISVFVEKNSNIKQAEAYSKELDDIFDILRKKHEEAKELLVRATVNSNKLLMLNPFLLEQKIHAIQKSFATLALKGNHA